MKHTLVSAAAVAALLGAAAVAQAAPAAHGKPSFVGAQYAAQAKISLDQARAIAVKAHPGQITDQELEKEGGGSGLRYSFEIKAGGKTSEVGVDAKTGRVLENKLEGPHPD